MKILSVSHALTHWLIQFIHSFKKLFTCCLPCARQCSQQQMHSIEQKRQNSWGEADISNESNDGRKRGETGRRESVVCAVRTLCCFMQGGQRWPQWQGKIRKDWEGTEEYLGGRYCLVMQRPWGSSLETNPYRWFNIFLNQKIKTTMQQHYRPICV